MISNLKLCLSSLVLLLVLSSCGNFEVENTVFKDRMRDFVEAISDKAKLQNPDFIIIPQNGQELVTTDAQADGPPHLSYLNAIDGLGREDVFFGEKSANRATKEATTDYLISYLNRFKENGKQVLVTDYCSDPENVTYSFTENEKLGFISYVDLDKDKELKTIANIPNPIWNENSDTILSLNQAKNFLYLINSENFPTKQAFIQAVGQTNYDVVIMDLFLEGQAFNASELAQLKVKANGATRLVVSYMSIGEAEDYRFYWDASWEVGNPSWIANENKRWKGNFVVEYWNKDWQNIILGDSNSYLQRVMNAGFDGVYLDIIDGYENFE